MIEHSSNSPSETNAWRDNWFVKNWLTAIPIVGAFFKTANVKEAANHAGHYIFTIAGGTTLMILEALPISMEDSAVVKHAKMTTNMAIGMAVGEVCYNTLFSVGKAVVSQLGLPGVSLSKRTPNHASSLILLQ